MSTMNAAVVTSFGRPPQYRAHIAPEPRSDDEVPVTVQAVGLHPRVRSGAAGSHYTSTGVLPLIPGIDGVGRCPDGTLVYFAADDVHGTMAERAVADRRRSIELHPDADAVEIAAAMNPAMSPWVALRGRVRLQPGQSVLVLGATGNAGAMAVQIAALLGAGRVIGAGRDRGRLEALHDRGADGIVPITDDPDASARVLAEAAADVDIVLDYLWGPHTQASIPQILRARADRSRALDWVQIGSVGGPDILLPSAALRSANLRLIGSGQGSMSPRGYLAELPSLVDAITAGEITVRTRAVPLRDIESAWTEAEAPGIHTVVIP
jgi:NADPH:quinone reductase-like Zn-dependent oxidoreductase